MSSDCQSTVPGILATEPVQGVRAFTQPIGQRRLSFYAVEGREGAVLVDAGLPGSVRAALEQDLLKAPLTTLVITHADADHLGDAAYLKEQFPDLRIACHPLDKLWCQDHDRLVHERYDCARRQGWDYGYSPETLRAMREACGPDFSITDELSVGSHGLFAGAEWKVLALPGHSMGHIGLWRQSDGTLIAGDAVLGLGPPNESGMGSMPPTHQYIAQYLTTISLLKTLPVRVALTGHWPPLDSRAFSLLLDESEHCLRRDLAWIMEASADRHLFFKDVVDGLNAAYRTWDAAEDVHYFYAVCGYLECLFATGLLQREGDRIVRT